jgi:hypothetical protein
MKRERNDDGVKWIEKQWKRSDGDKATKAVKKGRIGG